MSALAFPEQRRPWLLRLIGEARRRQRRRQLTIAGCVLAVIVVAASVYFGLGWGSAPDAAGGTGALAQAPAPADSTGFPPPIADELHSGYLPLAGPMVLGDGSLWVNTPDPARVVCTLCTAKPAGAAVSRVDPRSDRVIATIGVGPRGGGDISAGFGSIWAINRGAGTVSRIDPGANAVTATIVTGGSPRALTAGPAGIWVADDGESGSGASLVEIDPSTNRVSGRLPLADSPVWVAGTAGSIWVGDPKLHAILRVDPATVKVVDTIAAPPVGAGSDTAVDGSGDLWFSGGGAKPRLERLDPTTRTITTVLTETVLAHDRLQGIDALTYGHGAIWLSGFCGQGTTRVLSGGSVYCLLQIDPASNRVELTRALPFGNVGREPERANVALAYDGRTLWFSFYGAWNVQPVNPRLIVVCGPYKWHGAGVFATDCHTKKP